MAEDIEKQEELDESKKDESQESSESSLTPDYEALAQVNEAIALAEKERADAAEALIVKNKSLAKRHRNDSEEGIEEEDRPISRKDLEEALRDFKPIREEESEESKRLALAQQKVKEAEAKRGELARALKAKDSVINDSAETQRDGMQGNAPKLPDNSPLKSYKHEGNGVYSKKLASGKTMYVNTKATANDAKKWVE